VGKITHQLRSVMRRLESCSHDRFILPPTCYEDILKIFTTSSCEEFNAVFKSLQTDAAKSHTSASLALLTISTASINPSGLYPLEQTDRADLLELQLVRLATIAVNKDTIKETVLIPIVETGLKEAVDLAQNGLLHPEETSQAERKLVRIQTAGGRTSREQRSTGVEDATYAL